MIIYIFATDMKKILKVDNPNDHTLSQLSYPSFCLSNPPDSEFLFIFQS